MQRTVPTREYPREYGRVYERFLGMPVPVLLVVLWLVGTAILGACGLALYALLVAALSGV